MKKEKKKEKKKRCIIFAGVNSSTWDSEAHELAEVLREQGIEVLRVIPINGLDCPKIEFID